MKFLFSKTSTVALIAICILGVVSYMLYTQIQDKKTTTTTTTSPTV